MSGVAFSCYVLSFGIRSIPPPAARAIRMKVSLLVCCVLTFVLSACSSIPVVPFPVDPALPLEWGKYDTKFLNDSQCPDLQGQYSSPTTKFVVEQLSHEEKSEFTDYFGLFPWALADKQEGKLLDAEKDNTLLSFLQPSEETFLIELELPGESVRRVYKFEKADGDYFCEGGILWFPERQSFGGIEGSSMNGQSRTSIRATNDGALVVLSTYGPYRSKNMSKGVGFVHEFYRFNSI